MSSKSEVISSPKDTPPSTATPEVVEIHVTREPHPYVAKAIKIFWLVVDQWFLIGIGVVIALAHSYPNVARSGGILKSQYTIKYLLVAIIFFLSGLSLPPRNLYKRARDWKLHLATQLTNFLLFPTICFAIVVCVKAADPEYKKFNRFALAGMVVMGCVPTTISSNVVMTGQAKGDQSAATIEVMLGNLIGTFLSPALLQMFFSAPGWDFAQPKASGPGGTTEIYRQVIEQLGCSVFVPLFIGEIIQYYFPKPVKLLLVKYKLSKLGSLCLLGVIWSTFSTAFYSHAFQALSGEVVTFVLLVNILIYLMFSAFLFIMARLIPIPRVFRKPATNNRAAVPKALLFDAPTTVALLFCGAAKGIALGGPIVQIMYGGLETQDAAIITLPLVLYQGSQVVLGQIAVAILKAWVNRLAKRCVDVEEAPIAKAGDRDPTMVEESAPVMDSQK